MRPIIVSSIIIIIIIISVCVLFNFLSDFESNVMRVTWYFVNASSNVGLSCIVSTL